MTSPIIIRPSSLPSYADCPRRMVARGYRSTLRAAGFDLPRTLPPVGALVGTATHAGAAFTLQSKLDTGELGNGTEAVQRGLQSFDTESADGMTLDPTTPRAGDAHRQIERMVQTYRRTVAPMIEPVSVEQRLDAVLDERFSLSGQKDSRTRTPNGIVDLKTGARARAAGAQYGAYALIEKAHDQPVDVLSEDFIQRVRINKPAAEPARTTVPAGPAMRAAWHLIVRFRADMTAFLDGDPSRGIVAGDPLAFVANPASQMCGPKYCPAFGTAFCTEHRK